MLIKKIVPEKPKIYIGLKIIHICLKCKIIIRMEICKAPTPRLKALNKHNTHNVIETENVINNLTKLTLNVDINKGSSIAMYKMHTRRARARAPARTHARPHARTHTHTHTHTLQALVYDIFPSTTAVFIYTHIVQTDSSVEKRCLTEIF